MQGERKREKKKYELKCCSRHWVSSLSLFTPLLKKRAVPVLHSIATLSNLPTETPCSPWLEWVTGFTSAGSVPLFLLFPSRTFPNFFNGCKRSAPRRNLGGQTWTFYGPGRVRDTRNFLKEREKLVQGAELQWNFSFSLWFAKFRNVFLDICEVKMAV